MKLWSDYEGRTIAEAYPLKRLVRPEGRSAFFLTTNGTGTPALVRVIEAHFDEADILNRWKTVSEIGQENLVTMRKFGQTELDGTPLVYAVMEPTEISLAELLEHRTMTVEEAREMAYGVVGALEALHARNLVHGQVEAENILAAGETVKLRSDCVREITFHPDSDGPTPEELKTQDAQALATVLLQALTGRTTLQGSTTVLPSPFDGIIRNALSGRWGLPEMSAALGPKPKPVPMPEPKPEPVRPVAQAVATAPSPEGTTGKPVAPIATAVAPSDTSAKTEATAAAPVAVPKPEPKPSAQQNLFTPAATAQADGATASSKTSPQYVAGSLASGRITPAAAPDVRHRIVRPVEEEPKRTRTRLAIAAAVLVLLILGWRMLRTEPANANGDAKPVSTLAAAGTAGNAGAPAAAKPSASRPAGSGKTAVKPVPTAASAPIVTAGSGGERTQWRVVAYTYNHPEQAQQKAESIRSKYPAFAPEVFSPTGRAPYLVTLGGPMSRDQAEAFKNKARREGLPRDTYTQNYSR